MKNPSKMALPSGARPATRTLRKLSNAALAHVHGGVEADDPDAVRKVIDLLKLLG
jgi:hypothetical protein